MPEIPEIALNSKLGEVLKTKRSTWRNNIYVEQTGLFPDNPVIDPNSLSPKQLEMAREQFWDLRTRTLLPANEAYRDENRKALDAFRLGDLLGISSEVLVALDNLRLCWCAEPSVHGNKSTAPNLA